MSQAATEEDMRECRQRLAAALKRDSLPDAAWGDAVQSGLPWDAIREGYRGDEWNELVAQTDTYLKRARLEETEMNLPPERPGRGAGTKEVGVELDDYSRRRAETWSEVAAVLAARRAAVRWFRAEYLGGQLLTRKVAGEWLYGDSAPPGALEELRNIAKTLNTAYRWRVDAAAWFVLTGDAPFVAPVNVHVSIRCSADRAGGIAPERPWLLDDPDFRTTTAEITIVAEPWFSADVVAAAYRSVQRQLLGGDNRKKNARTLDAIRFAARCIQDTGAVRWEEIRRLWNEKEPDRGYKTRGGLPQAFGRFLRPEYGDPNFKPFEPESWQVWRDAQRRKETEAATARFGPDIIPVRIDRLRKKS